MFKNTIMIVRRLVKTMHNRHFKYEMK